MKQILFIPAVLLSFALGAHFNLFAEVAPSKDPKANIQTPPSSSPSSTPQVVRDFFRATDYRKHDVGEKGYNYLTQDAQKRIGSPDEWKSRLKKYRDPLGTRGTDGFCFVDPAHPHNFGKLLSVDCWTTFEKSEEKRIGENIEVKNNLIEKYTLDGKTLTD